MPEDTPDTGDTTTTPDTGDTTSTPEPTIEEQLAAAQAEAEKWKTTSRKHEDRSKANAQAARELEELRRTSMSETEKAIAEARDAARAEAAREFGTRIAVEALRGVATGRVGDVDALIEGLDPTKFLDDDGQPDRDAIQSWIDKVAPPKTEDDTDTGSFFPDLGQGARQSVPLNSTQLERDLKAKLGVR